MALCLGPLSLTIGFFWFCYGVLYRKRYYLLATLPINRKASLRLVVQDK